LAGGAGESDAFVHTAKASDSDVSAAPEHLRRAEIDGIFLNALHTPSLFFSFQVGLSSGMFHLSPKAVASRF